MTYPTRQPTPIVSSASKRPFLDDLTQLTERAPKAPKVEESLPKLSSDQSQAINRLHHSSRVRLVQPIALFQNSLAPQQAEQTKPADIKQPVPIRTAGLARQLFTAADLPPPVLSPNSSPFSRTFPEFRRSLQPQFRYFAKVGNVPYMPRGGYKDLIRITDPFNRTAINNERNGTFEFENQTVPFHDVHVGGAHCLLSRIPASVERPLIPGIDNQSLIMKTFLSQSILSKDENISVENGAAQRVIDQHKRLREAQIPVAELYNEAAALGGCGYFLFEYVPNEFKITWSPNDTVESNPDLKKIYDLFHFAAEQQVDIVLRPSNLRRRDSKEIVLVDFLESPPKTHENLYFELENRICTFCQKYDSIYQQLLPAIQSLRPKI